MNMVENNVQKVFKVGDLVYEEDKLNPPSTCLIMCVHTGTGVKQRYKLFDLVYGDVYWITEQMMQMWWEHV